MPDSISPFDRALTHHFLISFTFRSFLSRSKKWEVCVPKNNKNILSIQGQHYFENWKPEEKEYDCQVYVLTTGDVLYLPRGTLHRPETTKEIGSMHLSIGLDVRGFR